MLGLITWNEIWNVIDLNKDGENDWLMKGPTLRFIETYKARAGFFTPYEDGKKFVGGLLATVVYPAALGIFAGLSAICAVLGAVIGIGGILVACSAALLGSYEFCDETIENARTVFHITGLALISTAICIFLAVANIFHAPLCFLTRSGASLASLMSGCVASTQEKKLESDQLEQQRMELTSI
jgi:hypothetical protein